MVGRQCFGAAMGGYDVVIVLLLEKGADVGGSLTC
jgi:hypothetical protein